MIDQYEFENLIEKMKKRKEEGDFKTAVKIADKIPWDEVLDVNVLMFAASIYDEAECYKDAKVILDYAYEIAPVKNRLYFALALINIKCKELKDGLSYYIDFCKDFPDDSRKYLLKYYILKAKGASYEQQKRILASYIEDEKDEKMNFELALICDKLGQKAEVIRYCNFIVDFFGVKKTGYGKNALLLKQKYETLSDREEKLLSDINMGYSKKENDDVEYEEPPKIYNEIRIDEDKKNIPEEKLERINSIDTKRINDNVNSEDELNEKEIENRINISYTPDEESYDEKEKYVPAFLGNEKTDKEKLKKLIRELKEEEKYKSSNFNTYRENSFKLLGREIDMKLSETKLHMIIEAHSKDEGIEIAKKELNYIHDILLEKTTIAKVSAYTMNERGFAYYVNQIVNKDLIIENAGQLKNEVIDKIEEYIINKKGNTIFALVDIINNFDKLATDRPAFVGRFDVYSVLSNRPQETLDVTKEEVEEYKLKKKTVVKEEERKMPETLVDTEKLGMTVEEFVEECKDYAKSIDCALYGETIPILYEIVEEMKDKKVKLTKENAVALIEEAADRAEKPKLFGKAKYTKEGLLVLSEEHFRF